jgi:hypothetical protein
MNRMIYRYCYVPGGYDTVWVHIANSMLHRAGRLSARGLQIAKPEDFRYSLA